MTSDEFRSSPDRVARMRELLQDPVLAAAVVCLKEEGKQRGRVNLNDDPMASVRMYERWAERELVIDELIELSTPLPKYEPEPEPSWGVSPAEAFKTVTN